jgi:hypothetical protein
MKNMMCRFYQSVYVVHAVGMLNIDELNNTKTFMNFLHFCPFEARRYQREKRKWMGSN